jgi:glucosamine--fructose-6-phosphate aminotransferase (isomerizing)
MTRGIHTRNEIWSQPAAWRAALAVHARAAAALAPLLAARYDQVIFTGCGSTYYLALAAAALFQEQTGRRARAAPAGELLLHPATVLTDGRTLLVAVSRSGATTETVRATERFRQDARGPVIAITNYGDQPLAGLADVALVIEQGQETSVAQTRSFASLYVAATALTMQAAGRDDLAAAMDALPDLGAALLERCAAPARALGENLALDRFYFLGSGTRYGLACEVSLKMKEMTLTHSEPFHFLEFRHGPKSMVSAQAAVVGLLATTSGRHERQVLAETAALGGTIFDLAEHDAQIAFASALSEAVRGVLYLPVLQMMAYYRALAKGLDPDNPANLTAVVTLGL